MSLEIGLSPHHYVDFKVDESKLEASAQPQTVLAILIEPEKKPVKGTEAVADKEIPTKEALQKLFEESGVSGKVEPFVKGSRPFKDFLEALSEVQYTQVVLVGDDTQDLRSVAATWLKDRSETLELDGHLFLHSNERDVSALTTDAAQYSDNPNVTLVPSWGSPKPWEWVLRWAALNAAMAVKPSKPYSGVRIRGVSAPENPPKLKQRNELLSHGVATFVTSGTDVYLDRLVTTKTENAQKAQDLSLRDLNTKQILSYLRFDLKTYLGQICVGKALAKDNYGYSDHVITLESMKALILGRFKKWQSAALVQDPDGEFSKKLRVDINTANGSLGIFMPIVLMGQLYTTQTTIAFSK